MQNEAITGLSIKHSGTYVDCTLGGGGHSCRIAEALGPDGTLIGIDQDTAAIEAASQRLEKFSCKIQIVHDNFSHLENILQRCQIEKADGFLFDLGVSSYQIDTQDRGFSYMHDGKLDMRMDQGARLSAYDIVNGYSAQDLERIFKDYGEERWARRIASIIVERRNIAPLETTFDLVDAVQRAIPLPVRRKMNGHPAKRVFQAIRIEVNNELGIIKDTLQAAIRHLKPGGRIAVITFHSLEDRIVKKTFRQEAQGCICPPDLPVCACGHKPSIRLCGKAILPSEQELCDNSRAASAKLRIAEKI